MADHNPSSPTEPRVFVHDIKPYDVLDDLRGPGSGTIVLPIDVYWVRPSDTANEPPSGRCMTTTTD